MRILEPTPGQPPRRRIPRFAWLPIAAALGALFAWLTGADPSRMLVYALIATGLMGVQLLFQRWMERPLPKPDPAAPPTDWQAPDVHQDRFLGLPIGETGAQLLALAITIVAMLLIYGTDSGPWGIAIVGLGLFGVLGVLALRRALGL